MKFFWICTIIILMVSCIGKTDSVQTSNDKQEQSVLYEILDSQKSGIDFENKIIETPEMNGFNYMNFNNGAGVAVADFNNDRLQDIYFLVTTQVLYFIFSLNLLKIRIANFFLNSFCIDRVVI